MFAQIMKLSILNSGIQIKFTFQYFHEYTHFNIVPIFRICMHDWHTLCLFILINSCKYNVYRYRRVAEIQIFEKTYLIVIKDETGLKFKINDSTLFLIGSYSQKLVASY